MNEKKTDENKHASCLFGSALTIKFGKLFVSKSGHISLSSFIVLRPLVQILLIVCSSLSHLCAVTSHFKIFHSMVNCLLTSFVSIVYILCEQNLNSFYFC